MHHPTWLTTDFLHYFSFFFNSFMYMCISECVLVFVCSSVCPWVYECMWRPKIGVRSLPQALCLLFVLLDLDCLLTSWLAPGIPVSAFQGCNYRWATAPPWHLLGSGDPNSSPLICMESALSAEPSSQCYIKFLVEQNTNVPSKPL